MLLATVAVVFAALVLLSMPIVFALGLAGIAGLWIGGYPMQQLSSAMVSGSQSWVLLAIPAFVFAGNLMERCGMSHALVEFARALIGWVKGGLGMSVIVVAYFFSDICGSKMAEVSALGSALMPPLSKAGYDRSDSASLIAAGTAMGKIAYDSAILTAAVVFLLAVASVYQYLMGVSGVPQLLGQMLGPLKMHPWLFLIGTAVMSCLFGMLLEGLPAAVVLIPVVFPIAEAMGIDPIHFNIVQTAAAGIGLFLPPMGVGLLMALRFAKLGVGEHFRTYTPYMLALFAGLLIIICIPEISLTLPRLAGLIR